MQSVKKCRRVVVTGLGMITPLGFTVENNWNNILKGETNFQKLSSEEYKHFPCKVAAQIDKIQFLKEIQPLNFLKQSDIKSMSAANMYSLISAHQALEDSCWKPNEEEENFRAGVSIATGMAGVLEISEAALSLKAEPLKGNKTISPYFIPKILPNLSGGLISIRFNLKGPNHCVTTACAAGTHAITDAYEMIKQGRANMMLCGATESCIHPVAIAGFSRMRALSTKYNEQPSKSSRPFDKNRDGFVMSEGAGCLVIECLDTYLERTKKAEISPKIYAEILGYGINSDANHITNPAPDGNGALRCMKSALEDSNLTVDQIDYVNSHATSTPAGDLAEITAIQTLFKNSSQKVYISSLKGSLGHLLGAAGAVESILTIKAIQNRIIPPSINIENLDTGFNLEKTPNLEIVANQKRNFTTENQRMIGLKNSFGFGGTNVSICFSSFEAENRA